jgi:hypothetical protein
VLKRKRNRRRRVKKPTEGEAMAPGMSSFSATITSSTAPCVAAAPPHPRARHSLPQAARLQCKGNSSCCSSSLYLSIYLTDSNFFTCSICIALHCIVLHSIHTLLHSGFDIGRFLVGQERGAGFHCWNICQSVSQSVFLMDGCV